MARVTRTTTRMLQKSTEVLLHHLTSSGALLDQAVPRFACPNLFVGGNTEGGQLPLDLAEQNH